ncbi:hypothetical protein DHEL01_v206409 [Diaporthe helianthi]|uniref:Uncharacterized protein n=1 Tax=Diaporthe helianthi TaxID=158607 RepID=A0A2P5HY66_DIAHE|nr:hypothetical protein DHEL01_v206409 [Diaporthe helianthi]
MLIMQLNTRDKETWALRIHLGLVILDSLRITAEQEIVTDVDAVVLPGPDAALFHIIRRKTKMAAAELHRDVRERLEDVIVPIPDKDFICANSMVHVKSDSGSTKVARGQAAHNDALAARGMQAWWDFGDMSSDRSRHTDAENQFRQGLAAYRNGLDWAKRQARRGHQPGQREARVEAERANPGEEDLSDDVEEDDEITKRFDSQRTIRTRSMSQKQHKGKGER